MLDACNPPSHFELILLQNRTQNHTESASIARSGHDTKRSSSFLQEICRTFAADAVTVCIPEFSANLAVPFFLSGQKMGSWFSKPGTHPRVGDVRPREASSANRAYEENAQRPKKRIRVSDARRKPHDRASHPATRATQLTADPICAQDAVSVESTRTTPLLLQNGLAPEARPKRRKKRKVAVFLGYIGAKYHGMQINPGVVTIEQVLLEAFHNAGVISEGNKQSLSKVHWMRAARTDKGVSAAGQCVSVKLECEVDKRIDPKVTQLINHHLPEDVRVYGMLRTTGGFNARSDCHRRRYEYMFPVRLLGGCNGVETETGVDKGDPRCAKLTSILRRYEGTHCFANFTDGLQGSDDAARRYMISVRCRQPFLPPNSGVYFVTVEIYGQSFLLHQIRKMVGLALYIYLGHAPPETIPVALSPLVKIPTPMAPSLGLLLDELMFDNYNKRFQTKLETQISSQAFAEAKQTFKFERIYAQIAQRERLERILENWVKTCNQRQMYNHNEILEKHAKFIQSNRGKEEQRRAYVASLYSIITKEDDFVSPSTHEMRAMVNELKRGFEKRYDQAPTFLARAPGRVILIGEHLDYNGLPVIATALSKGTMVAGCLDTTEHIDVQHVEEQVHGNGRLRVDGLRMVGHSEPNSSIDYNWIQYVSWGIKSLSQSLPANRSVSGGGRLLFGGDLPRAGGLASSSSLVTVSALAAARMNRKRFPKLDLAVVAANGERVGAGTRGGAVDHCVSMCGVKNGALLVSFAPRAAVTELSLPKGASFFAVDSGVKAEKGFDDNVKREFNLRAAECRIAAALLARRLNVHLEKSVTTPGQLLFQARKTGKLQCKDITTLQESSKAVMSVDEVLTTEDVRKELEVSDTEWHNRFLVGVEAERFAVGKRISHVFSETERVDRWVRAVSDAALTDAEKVEALGEILNEGHESLRTLFESSCTEVNDVVAFCRTNGALGSRMTGAGWGGYTINLVPMENVLKFLQRAKERYGEGSILEVKPSLGACIFAIHSSYGTPRREHEQKERENGTS